MHRIVAMGMLACWAAGANAAPPTVATAGPVLAHYMPWFRAEPLPDGQLLWDHWQWHGSGPKHDPDERRGDGRRDIASVFYPLIGPYDGRDPAVLEYHVGSARLAGINGFVVDWYGPGTYSDAVFAGLLAAAGRGGLSVAVCLEEKAFFPGYTNVATRAAVLAEAERQMRHVLDTHAAAPAYLRVADRPVFYLFVNHQQGPLGHHSLTPEEWRAVMSRFEAPVPWLVRAHADPAYEDSVPAVFAWVGDAAYRSNFYAVARADENAAGQARTGALLPGFDDTGVWGWGRGPRVIPRNGMATYDEHWRDALAHRPSALQIITWNDFQEGSTIEPTTEYGFQYLDRTEEWVEQWSGRPSRLTDNEWPYRLYRLRRAAARVSDDTVRLERNRLLDTLSEDLMKDRHRWMGFRLWRLERKWGGDDADSKGAWE